MQDVVVNQPKAASQESALAGREPIDAVIGFIPQDKLILDEEPLLNRFESCSNPWVIGRKKTNERNQKQTCVQALRAEGLHEAIDLSVEPALANFCVDLIGDPSPFSPRLMKRFRLDAAGLEYSDVGDIQDTAGSDRLQLHPVASRMDRAARHYRGDDQC